MATQSGLASIYDVNTGQRLRSWRGQQSRAQTATRGNIKSYAVSYCRSVVAPYLVAVGEGSMIGLFDVRAKEPTVSLISGHSGHISSLQWSVNQSSDMMRLGSPDQVMLSSGCTDGSFGVWNLSQILQAGKQSIIGPDSSQFWMSQMQESPLTAVAWHPKKFGHLVTGADQGKTIYLWDMSKSASQEGEDYQELKHILQCC